MTSGTFIAGRGMLYLFDARAKLLTVLALCVMVFLPLRPLGLWVLVAATVLGAWHATGLRQALQPLRAILFLLVIMILFTPLTAVPVFKNFQPHLFFDTGLKERRYAFRDRCSRLVEITETVELPAGIKPYRVPGKIERNGKAASFTGGYTLGLNAITYSAKGTYGKRLYDAADWPEFRAAVEGQNRFGDAPVIFQLQDARVNIQN